MTLLAGMTKLVAYPEWRDLYFDLIAMLDPATSTGRQIREYGLRYDEK